MANLKLRYLTVVIFLILTMSVVNSLQFDSTLNSEPNLSKLQDIPLNFGGKWQGKDYALEEFVYKILETRSIIHRSFITDTGQNVFLSIVHYSDTKVDFHTPEACIGGRGLETKKSTKELSLYSGDRRKVIEVAEMITTKNTGQTLTYYFYKSGKFTGSNYIKMRLNIAANKLTQKDASGSLIRISTTLPPGGEAKSSLLLTEFLEDLFPFLQKAL